MTDHLNTPNNEACCEPSTGCRGGTETPSVAAMAGEQLRSTVRAGYAEIARSGTWSEARAEQASGSADAGVCCSGGGCCGPTDFTPDQLAQAIGYSDEELAATPDAANMGLSCGNPTALASLSRGEVVLDLGSGGGFDCFIAGIKVGAEGRVIGVDMTPEMVGKARANAVSYAERTGHDNVEFRLGEIEHLPVPDASVDVVISNCVLNLAPDKPQVWREIARVLRPGGRVAVSDLALLRELPEAIRADAEALVGCVSGAVPVDDTRSQMAEAGLVDIRLTPKSDYVDAMSSFGDPLYDRLLAGLPEGTGPGDFITSLDMEASKA
ncbi:MAG: arsenite methyltransferase [Planctomycetota bacterium]